MCTTSDDYFLGKSRLANSKSALSLENKRQVQKRLSGCGERRIKLRIVSLKKGFGLNSIRESAIFD